jgi:hypothetical protein
MFHFHKWYVSFQFRRLDIFLALFLDYVLYNKIPSTMTIVGAIVVFFAIIGIAVADDVRKELIKIPQTGMHQFSSLRVVMLTTIEFMRLRL